MGVLRKLADFHSLGPSAGIRDLLASTTSIERVAMLLAWGIGCRWPGPKHRPLSSLTEVKLFSA